MLAPFVKKFAILAGCYTYAQIHTGYYKGLLFQQGSNAKMSAIAVNNEQRGFIGDKIGIQESSESPHNLCNKLFVY
jgi:hypothetical protein